MRISREGQLVTLINVFETKPEQQQALIDAWLRFVESVKNKIGCRFSHIPFVVLLKRKIDHR